MRIQLWEESIDWQEAMARLSAAGLDAPVLQNTLRQLVIERSLREHHLLTPPDAPSDAPPAAAEDPRLSALKAHVIPDPLIAESFIHYKARRETVIFQCMRLPDKPLARELYFRLQHDHTDFYHLAQQYGEGADTETGGLNGPIPLERLRPDLRQRLQALRSGECTEPFAMPSATSSATPSEKWMILRLLRRDEFELTPEIRERIREELFTDWLERQIRTAAALPEAIRKARAGRTERLLSKRGGAPA